MMIDSILYLTTLSLKVVALNNTANGQKTWEYDPYSLSEKGGVNRGFASWQEGKEKRLFDYVSNRLRALDLYTGKLISGFSLNGSVDLRDGNDKEKVNLGNILPDIIYNDLIVLGSGMGEEQGSLSGHIRAYDVKKGNVFFSSLINIIKLVLKMPNREIPIMLLNYIRKGDSQLCV